MEAFQLYHMQNISAYLYNFQKPKKLIASVRESFNSKSMGYFKMLLHLLFFYVCLETIVIAKADDNQRKVY